MTITVIPSTRVFNNMPWFDSASTDHGRCCETCGRFLKIYRRKLSVSMAIALIRLHRLRIQRLARGERDLKFFHVRDFDRQDGRGEVSKLAYWGLVEEAANKSTEKRSSGLWAITPFGSLFVRNPLTPVPRHILLKWNSEFLGFSGGPVTIIDCLNAKFDYSELMKL